MFIQYGTEPEEETLAMLIKPVPGVLYYSIFDKQSNEMVGYIGVAEEFDDNLEFYIFQEHRGKQYLNEILLLFTDAYLNGELTGNQHTVIVAECLIDNWICEKVLKNNGFKMVSNGIRWHNENPDTLVVITRYEKRAS